MFIFKFNLTGHIVNTNKRPGIWHNFQMFLPTIQMIAKMMEGIKILFSDVASSLSTSQEPLPFPPSDLPTFSSLL